ncbi:putative nuclease HARBI1 [Temnothorax longispinosus]|uniref:putative nuclease HARBI1 n=1 Tax=Temnothorax longispinosus TaxID=300112 RepID=UPI003A9A0AF4
MSSISFAFRVGLNTVSKIISETCEAIWNILKEKVFPEITEDFWREKANEFETQWNFPNCIGAIDGRHMAIVAPPHSGSTYFNYKGTHSIVLLAIADANYCFTAVDIGAEGRRSDGGIFAEMGDEAFALTSFMMRPYPRANDLNLRQKVFNYRLSRARRIVECAFGIFTARWRIFRRPLSTNVNNAIAIVKATVCLHNFLMQKDLAVFAEKRQYMSLSLSNHVNVYNCAFQALHCFDNNTERNNVIQSAVNIRDAFKEFFCTAGAIEQQWEKALHNDF